VITGALVTAFAACDRDAHLFGDESRKGTAFRFGPAAHGIALGIRQLAESELPDTTEIQILNVSNQDVRVRPWRPSIRCYYAEHGRRGFPTFPAGSFVEGPTIELPRHSGFTQRFSFAMQKETQVYCLLDARLERERTVWSSIASTPAITCNAVRAN
jgi:hypothetical protein